MTWLALALACGGAPPQDPHAGMDMGPAPDHAGPGAHPAAEASVEVSPQTAELLGIRAEPARAGDAGVARRAPATVGWDPLEVTRIAAQPGGQVRELLLPRTGERIEAGARVARLYQPDVRAAFEELRVATGLGEPWVSAARSRLLASGVSKADVDAASAGRTPELYTVRAPSGGVVLERTAVEGSWIGPGGVLAVIGDPKDLVVDAVVTGAPPAPGAPVVLRDPATGESWQAEVSGLLPTAGAAGASVRLVPRGEIAVGRPLVAEWTDTTTGGVWVPSTALVDTGRRRVVFVQTAPGSYAPRQVEVGVFADGQVQVTSGVRAGELVVVAGTFLLDSETQIGTAGHAGHGT